MRSSPSAPPSSAIIARLPKAAMPDDTKPMERPEAPELSKVVAVPTISFLAHAGHLQTVLRYLSTDWT
jgi:hypothetical protein